MATVAAEDRLAVRAAGGGGWSKSTPDRSIVIIVMVVAMLWLNRAVAYRICLFMATNWQ